MNPTSAKQIEQLIQYFQRQGQRQTALSHIEYKKSIQDAISHNVQADIVVELENKRKLNQEMNKLIKRQYDILQMVAPRTSEDQERKKDMYEFLVNEVADCTIVRDQEQQKIVLHQNAPYLDYMAEVMSHFPAILDQMRTVNKRSKEERNKIEVSYK